MLDQDQASRLAWEVAVNWPFHSAVPGVLVGPAAALLLGLLTGRRVLQLYTPSRQTMALTTLVKPMVREGGAAWPGAAEGTRA
jgi:hypothetical protein